MCTFCWTRQNLNKGKAKDKINKVKINKINVTNWIHIEMKVYLNVVSSPEIIKAETKK